MNALATLIVLIGTSYGHPPGFGGVDVRAPGVRVHVAPRAYVAPMMVAPVERFQVQPMRMQMVPAGPPVTYERYGYWEGRPGLFFPRRVTWWRYREMVYPVAPQTSANGK